MGKLNCFSITFNSPQIVYYPGQTLSGFVTVDLNQPMDVKEIKLEIKGKGYVHWTEERTEGEGEDSHTETIHFTGKETIISWKNILCGGHGSNRFTLPEGNHTYPFSFTLPSSLPSSFEYQHYSPKAYIRYYIKAKLDKPWKFDHKVKRPFTVNDIIDTNKPMYSQPVGGNAHRDVGCLCCKAGPVDMSASIDRQCYCPGEAILVTADVQNQTTRNMENIHAKLIQTIEFRARDKTRKVTMERGRLAGPPIPPGETANWTHQPFGIPALPPTITNSSVITIHYKVKVVVAVPCGIDGVVKMHITVGTVPFRQTYGQAVQYETQYDPAATAPAANFMGDSAYPPPQVAAFGYPDMPPPSYSAAVGDQAVNITGKKDDYTYGDLNYAPVYTFAQPYQGSYQGPPPPIADPNAQPPQPCPPADPNAPVQPYPPAGPNAVQPVLPPQPTYDPNAPPPPGSMDSSAPPPVA